jgi:hypothetical protein
MIITSNCCHSQSTERNHSALAIGIASNDFEARLSQFTHAHFVWFQFWQALTHTQAHSHSLTHTVSQCHTAIRKASSLETDYELRVVEGPVRSR